MLCLSGSAQLPLFQGKSGRSRGADWNVAGSLFLLFFYACSDIYKEERI
jgi:hypothetical protein